jgi:hypothetical protein
MAIKTFTTGEVLTASDTNTYLANSGLVYVKQQTVGNNVSSVEITGAFSATYDHYRVIYMGGTCSVQSDLGVYLGSTAPANGYYQTIMYVAYGASTVVGASLSNGAKWTALGVQENPNSMAFDIYNPFANEKTSMQGMFMGVNSVRVAGNAQGFYNATTSYTSFTIVSASGNISGGVVYVYGYRKA